MPRDRSLEEFVDRSDSEGERTRRGEDTSEGGATSPDQRNEGSETESGGQSDDLEAIEPTYGWSIDGAVCESCGATVESRWLGDGALVCADCKEW